jgi:hypothetical protein
MVPDAVATNGSTMQMMIDRKFRKFTRPASARSWARPDGLTCCAWYYGIVGRECFRQEDNQGRRPFRGRAYRMQSGRAERQELTMTNGDGLLQPAGTDQDR